ncbi:T9SS type A sorting domain-containing protein [Flavobacterium sp.]|uniref:DUF7619 domain-containing protein n=1 Tax=Flavobacterium sp. TaxID=239 RepID=UPI00262D5D52|nr:T9SS type A sorting domain-containing protein [Flavobacterium sp.]
MKSITGLLLFFSVTIYGQIINIPDPAFKAKLVSAVPENGIAKNFSGSYITIDANHDGEIQQAEANQVYKLYVVNSTIASLEGIQYFNTLEWLECYNNAITTLDLTSMDSLEWVDCSNNLLTYVHMPTTIAYLNCAFNQLATIDVSNSHWITDLVCSFNPQLQSIFVKNGSYCNITLVEDFNLQYICADPEEFYAINTRLDYAGITGCEVNSYCSFTPGGGYDTITGSVSFDADNNGCDAADPLQANVRLNITDFTTQFATATGFDGHYAFYAPPGTYAVTPSVEHPEFFTVSPATVTIPFIYANVTSTQDFCVTANGVHNDLETVIAPITPAIPGFSAKYLITYKNKGNQVMSLTDGINFNFDSTHVGFLSANIEPSLQNAGSLNWSYENLMPLESRSILVTMHINAPTDPNPVNLNDVLHFSSTISPQNIDENADDNAFALNQTVVGSFDPNDITCLEGENVSPTEIGKYLHYLVNFENTGTYAAQNIVVKDTIDTAKFDVSSLQVLNASHNVDARLTGNVLELIFQDIQLDPAAHGHVVFKIRSKDNLVTGDSVAQQAGIYFDYNFPVITNIATTVFSTLSAGDTMKDNSLTIYPNPTADVVHIKSHSNIGTIELFDAQGRILQHTNANGMEASLNMAQYTSGMYYVKVQTGNGVKTQQLLRK